MEFVEWKESYNVGVKEIDIQHRGLFDLVNKLTKTNDYDPEGRYFLLTFIEFIDYARLHFNTEERYMQEASYSRFEEHKQAHIDFLAIMKSYLEKLEKKQRNMENEILDYIKKWYSSHILGFDRDYIEVFRAKGFK